MTGSNASVDRQLRCMKSLATESMGTETPMSDMPFFLGSDSTLTCTLVVSISMTRTGGLEVCLMQHGESATNVSVLDELSPKETTDKGLTNRGIIPKALLNTIPFREDIRKEILLDECELDERTLHVSIRLGVGVT